MIAGRDSGILQHLVRDWGHTRVWVEDEVGAPSTPQRQRVLPKDVEFVFVFLCPEVVSQDSATSWARAVPDVPLGGCVELCADSQEPLPRQSVYFTILRLSYR